MRILVLGGTRFVGRHLVDAAHTAGHSVTVFNRGSAALPWDGVEQLTGNREGDLESLRGREWDVCLDVNGYLPQHVRASAGLLRGQVRHYTFISTVSVYEREAGGTIDEASPLHPVPADAADGVTGESYGPLKVACEEEVERAFPGRSLILRPGIIAGPFDPTNRFDWWVGRVGDGGEVLAPGTPESPVQVVDARDLARFAVAMLARRATGIYNVSGLPANFGELLPACREGTCSDATFTWVSEQLLLREGVEPFDELPLWLPDDAESRAFYGVSNARARGAGLELRPLAETARDTWEWLRAVRAGVLAPPVVAGFVARGLSREREAALLRA